MFSLQVMSSRLMPKSTRSYSLCGTYFLYSCSLWLLPSSAQEFGLPGTLSFEASLQHDQSTLQNAEALLQESSFRETIKNRRGYVQIFLELTFSQISRIAR